MLGFALTGYRGTRANQVDRRAASIQCDGSENVHIGWLKRRVYTWIKGRSTLQQEAPMLVLRPPARSALCGFSPRLRDWHNCVWDATKTGVNTNVVCCVPSSCWLKLNLSLLLGDSVSSELVRSTFRDIIHMTP